MAAELRELVTGQPARDMAIEAWVRPMLAQLDGVDLRLPAVTAAGEPAGTRREQLVDLLGETLVGYSDLVGRIQTELSGERQKRAIDVLYSGVSTRRGAAVQIGLTGHVPADLPSMAEIEMRAYEAAHSVSMRVL